MTARADDRTSAGLVRVWARRYAALDSGRVACRPAVPRNDRDLDAVGRARASHRPGIWWSIAGNGAVGGYNQDDFARYFFAVTLVGQFTVAWDAWYIDRWIRHGELNYRLTRPWHPCMRRLRTTSRTKRGRRRLSSWPGCRRHVLARRSLAVLSDPLGPRSSCRGPGGGHSLLQRIRDRPACILDNARHCARRAPVRHCCSCPAGSPPDIAPA